MSEESAIVGFGEAYPGLGDPQYDDDVVDVSPSNNKANVTRTAYSIIKRAKELGPSAREIYGNDVDVTLDEDALLQAIVEELERD